MADIDVDKIITLLNDNELERYNEFKKNLIAFRNNYDKNMLYYYKLILLIKYNIDILLDCFDNYTKYSPTKRNELKNNLFALGESVTRICETYIKELNRVFWNNNKGE